MLGTVSQRHNSDIKDIKNHLPGNLKDKSGGIKCLSFVCRLGYFIAALLSVNV